MPHATAVAEYRQVLRINSGDTKLQTLAHMNLAGLALRGQGSADEAIVEYRHGLRIEPDNAELHFGLGLALSLQGKHDEAIAEYREAVRINPSGAQFHYFLGVGLRLQGDGVGAARQLRDFLRLAPNSGVSAEMIERGRSILAELEKQ